MAENAPKKIRMVTKDQLAEFIKQFKDEAAKSTQEVVELKAIAKQFNVSTTIAKDIYLGALSADMPYVRLSTDAKEAKPKSQYPYINKKDSIMIGKTDIEKLNEQIMSEGLKFKIGDKFEISVNEERHIILKPL